MSAEDRVETDRKRHAAWAKFAKETGDTPAMPAATVVVLRDGPEGPETLMLRKNSTIHTKHGQNQDLCIRKSSHALWYPLLAYLKLLFTFLGIPLY